MKTFTLIGKKYGDRYHLRPIEETTLRLGEEVKINQKDYKVIEVKDIEE